MRERTGANWTPEEATKGEGREHFLGTLSEIHREVVKSYLAQQLARILKVPLGSVDGETSILKLGFDSLVAIEFKNRIETDLGITVGMDRLVQGPTPLELTDLIVGRLKAAQAPCAPPGASPSVEEFEEGEV
jgi:aryl carrier-like protein